MNRNRIASAQFSPAEWRQINDICVELRCARNQFIRYGVRLAVEAYLKLQPDDPSFAKLRPLSKQELARQDALRIEKILSGTLQHPANAPAPPRRDRDAEDYHVEPSKRKPVGLLDALPKR